MPHRHQPAATTRTIELRQLQEINQRLAERGRADATAEFLEVAGKPISSSSSPLLHVDLFGIDPPTVPVLRPTCVLHHLSAVGSPNFPYILGHFLPAQFGPRPTDGPVLVVDLDSDVLRRLSTHLGLRHSWGTDAAGLGSVVL